MTDRIRIAGYEYVEPTEPCLHPDGHERTTLSTLGSYIPTRALCSRCGQAWGIVVFQHETATITLYNDDTSESP